MDWQLVARYFTVKSTDFFFSVGIFKDLNNCFNILIHTEI